MEALIRPGGLLTVEDNCTRGLDHKGYMAPSVDFEVLDSAMTTLGKTTTFFKGLALSSLWADGEVRARHHSAGQPSLGPK
jgi:hypothetical protein